MADRNRLHVWAVVEFRTATWTPCRNPVAFDLPHQWKVEHLVIGSKDREILPKDNMQAHSYKPSHVKGGTKK
eukprot:6636887-Karenia_brevis.AAC.1